MNTASGSAAFRRRGGARPRTVLLVALAAVIVATGLHYVAPWLLPARVREGPMVQMAGPDAVTLVWYTTRPANCVVAASIGDTELMVDAVAEGTRNRVRISGLSPGTRYPYQVRVGTRRVTETLHFQTNRTPDDAYTFLVFGDSGTGNRAQYLLASVMTITQPPADFILHTGDLVYPDGARPRYEPNFFAPYRHLLARINFWPCLGNHDVAPGGSAAAYEEVFELPDNGPPGLIRGHNYWFDYAAARIVVVDSTVSEEVLRDRVAPWLSEILSRPDRLWKFVAFHHPPFTGGSYPPDLGVRRTLVPVMEQAGVDVVFTGHDHMYQRTYPLRDDQVVDAGQGVVYVVTAAGGARLYEARDPRPDYVAALDNQHFSFTQVSIRGDELTLRQIALQGHVLDEYTLRKPARPPDSEPAPED